MQTLGAPAGNAKKFRGALHRGPSWQHDCLAPDDGPAIDYDGVYIMTAGLCPFDALQARSMRASARKPGVLIYSSLRFCVRQSY